MSARDPYQQEYIHPAYDIGDEPDHVEDCPCNCCGEDRYLAEVNEAARADAIDKGELCGDCGSIDVKPAVTGPRYKIPVFECRECGCIWIDAVTRPTQDAWPISEAA